MGLNLHNNLKARLKEELAKQLPTIEVNNRSFLDRKTTAGFLLANEPLPKHGPITDRLESYIGEWPFYDFLYGQISKELNEEQQYDSSNPTCKLTDIEAYSNTAEASEKLVEQFNTLPWQYKFSIKFKPLFLPIFEGNSNKYELSDTVSLIKPDDSLISEFPLQSGVEGRDKGLFSSGLLSMFSAEEWDRESVYLQIATEGFTGKYITTQTSESVVSIFKAFCGLAIALRLIKVEHTYHPASPKMHFYIHKNVNGDWIIDDTEQLPEDLSRTINDLVFHDLEGGLDSDLKRKSWILSCLKKLKKVFSNTEQSERLFLAGQWFFESYMGRNELLSFVQLMVSLEILLGDKASSDIIGLGELLRNRCAYLIGKDHEQREKILKDFKDIYDIRSKIVHRGKSKLTRRESALFNHLQWICRRVIQEEIELITER